MLHKMKDEKGMLIIEAAFVYPIMFFVIFFLIYMGNMYYQVAKVNSCVNQEAIKGAAYFADPLLKGIYDSNQVPTKGFVDSKPYHFLDLWPQASTDISKLRNSVSDTGFFAGMKPKNVVITADVKNQIIYSTYVIQMDYDISFPIKFIFQEEESKLHFQSRAEVPAVDSTEFIRNTDLIIDYVQRTKGGSNAILSIKEGIDKLSKLLNGGT